MVPLEERLITLQDKAKATPAPSSVYPDGLSEREVEVLRLIAAGNSNQKIADELVLSRHTVVRHISNIFGKIDTSKTDGVERRCAASA